MNRLKKITVMSLVAMGSFFSPLSAYYNWQQHVPHGQYHSGNEDDDGEYNWQQHVPNWQQFIPNYSEDDDSSEEYNQTQRSPGRGSNKKRNTSMSSQTYYGPVSKSGYRGRGLSVFGPLSLTDSIVSGPLNVHGPVVLDETEVKGSITVYGVLTASNSTLNNIKIATTTVRLIDSIANDIVVLKNSDYPTKRQRVLLEGTTAVQGSIIFEQGNGIVRVAPNASFSGTVKGGMVEKQ